LETGSTLDLFVALQGSALPSGALTGGVAVGAAPRWARDPSPEDGSVAPFSAVLLAAAAPPKPLAPAPVAATKPIAAATVDPAKAKGKYTLHLSTFATADEANAFAQRYPGAFVVSGTEPCPAGPRAVSSIARGSFSAVCTVA